MTKEQLATKYMMQSGNHHASIDFAAGWDAALASDQLKRICILFSEWESKYSWAFDYANQKTHSTAENFDYFINKIYQP